MNRIVLLGLLALGGAGCVSGITCKTSADCPSTGFCDAELKVCIANEDGGTASGGGGGGTTGGGMGGGGGGGGGGGVVDCPSGCMDWQSCQPGDGGTCRNAAVTVVSPASRSLFGGGASARVVARVTDWDGGAFPRGSIPASGSTGVTAPMMMNGDDAGLFVGDFGLPAVAGTHTLTAGWPATNATVEVLTQVCTVMCADWEECVPNADGGTCSDLGLTLTWDLPTEDAKYAPNTNVALSLQVTRADGGGFSKAIPFTVSGGPAGTLTLNGSWIGTVPSGSSDARRSLEAGWSDGGPAHPIRHFLVDATPPVLGLVVVGDGGAFQRDAVVPAVLVSNEALDDAGVSLGGVSMARVADSACPNLASVDGGVACFQLDFSQPALNGLDGGFVATLSATDQYTNSGPGTGGVLPVTRVRWTTPATTQQVQALAIGRDGTLFVGTVATAGGSLFKILPAGDAGTPVALGDVQSLAVAAGASTTDVVYAAYNATGPVGSIGALETATLTRGSLRSPCEGATGSRTYSGLALYRFATETLALGSVNAVANDGTGCLYRPNSGSPIVFGGTTQFDSAVVSAAGPTVAANVVITGSTASFLRQDTAGAWWQPATLSGTSIPTITVGTPSQLTALAVAPAIGQALNAGQFLIATTNSGSGKQLFGRPTAADGNLGSNNDKGVPVLASSGEAYVGIGDALVRFSPGDLSTSLSIGTVSGDSIRTSPVLGAPRVSGGMAEGYAVSKLGTLLAFRQGTGAELWRAPLIAAGDSINTHMAFDCNRANPTSRTGVLYIGAASGKVLSIIVDAPKLLDNPDAWPKYQRSMGNAGNDDTTNFPTNWPGCP